MLLGPERVFFDLVCVCMYICMCSSICGVSVAVALADIHECEHKMEAKRFKGTCGIRRLPKPEPRLHDQPVSPFRLFM